MYTPILRVHCSFILIVFIKPYVVGQVNANQMSTHNICLYNEVHKKYTGWYLKIMKLLDCALIGVYAVIRSNMVCG